MQSGTGFVRLVAIDSRSKFISRITSVSNIIPRTMCVRRVDSEHLYLTGRKYMDVLEKSNKKHTHYGLFVNALLFL